MGNLLANRYVRLLLVIIMIVMVVYGIYRLGIHVQKTITDAITQTQEQMVSVIQKSIQSNLDGKVNDLSKKMDDNFNGINEKLNDAQNNIDQTRARLNNIGDVWLRVDKVSPTKGNSGSTGNQKGGSTGSQTGSDGVYYAKLPDENVQFLKGEAYRGDQCAVRLTAAQQALVQYKGAFEEYQRIVKDALALAKLK